MSGIALPYSVSSPYRYDHWPSLNMPMCRSIFPPCRSPNAGSPWTPTAGRYSLRRAHRRRLHRKDAATPAAATRPAPTAVSVAGSTFSWIGESACAGSPYRSGGSVSRKNAPNPPASVSSGSSCAPYRYAPSTPRPCSVDDALRGHLEQLVVRPELDRIGRAGLRARRLEAVLEPVVAERALRGAAVDRVAVDHAERARRDAVPAAVADVRLQHDGLELGADQRAGRARVQAAGVRAVLADVGHEHPVAEAGERTLVLLGGGDEVDAVGREVDRARGALRQLHEAHVPPGRGAQLAGVVVRAAAPERRRRPTAGRSTACTPPRTPCSRCTSWCR